MDSETRFSIGVLARRTGLSVKAIRFYSDRGIVPPAERTPSGYRRYGADAVARLSLVRTLRELGLDLATIGRILEREVSLTEVADAHAQALAVQIRVLCLRRAVLTVAARHGSNLEEISLMQTLATLSAQERSRLVDGFLDSVFDGLDDTAAFVGIRGSMTPCLPDEPTAEQIEAWVELAGLCQDPDFRANMRRTVREYEAERPGTLSPDIVAIVVDEAGRALSAGVDPVSDGADPVVAAVTTRYVAVVGRPDDVDLRRRLLARLRTVNDPRRHRYLRALCVINGWPTGDGLPPALDWFTTALGARTPA